MWIGLLLTMSTTKLSMMMPISNGKEGTVQRAASKGAKEHQLPISA